MVSASNKLRTLAEDIFTKGTPAEKTPNMSANKLFKEALGLAVGQTLPHMKTSPLVNYKFSYSLHLDMK